MKALSNSAQSWVGRRKIHDRLAPRLAIRDVRIRRSKKRDAYEVSIRGSGFRPWAVPPVVLINGQPLAQLRFSKDGTAIRGLVERRSSARQVLVDLGYAKALWTP